MSDLKQSLRRRLLGRRFQQNILDDHEVIKHLGNWHYQAHYRDLIAEGAEPPVNQFEFSVHSQNGEDGIILYLLSRIGVQSHYMVEIGIEDGRECNSANLILNFGWQAALFEGSERWAGMAREYFNESLADHARRVGVYHAFMTPENINAQMDNAGVPERIDVLSIDVDSFDYWLWQAFDHAEVNVVVMEYNASFGPERSVTYPRPEDRDRTGPKVEYFHGASITALSRLGEQKGFTLVGCDEKGVNAFFVKDDLVAAGGLKALTPAQAFRPHYWRTKAKSLEEQMEILQDAPCVEV